jgi:hypothetical protein
MVLCLSLVLLAAACGRPAFGSKEDLSRQIDNVQLPAPMVEMGQSYMGNCPSTCPLLVRWYDVGGPIDSIRTDIVSSIESAGISVNQASASPGLFAAKNEEYIFFVVLDSAMLARNTHAPPGADAEISVHVLPEG